MHAGKTRPTLFIAGEGGHTARVVALLERGQYPAKRTIVAVTKAQDAHYFGDFDVDSIWVVTKPNPLNCSRIRQIPRWIKAFFEWAMLTAWLRPGTVVGGGSNSCILPIIMGKAAGAHAAICESFVQIDQPSRTARLLDKVVDEVICDWPFQRRWFRHPRWLGAPLVPDQGVSGVPEGGEVYPSMKMMKAIQEGVRFRATIREDVSRKRQESFIRFLQARGQLDAAGYSTRRGFAQAMQGPDPDGE